MPDDLTRLRVQGIQIPIVVRLVGNASDDEILIGEQLHAGEPTRAVTHAAMPEELSIAALKGVDIAILKLSWKCTKSSLARSCSIPVV